MIKVSHPNNCLKNMNYILKFKRIFIQLLHKTHRVFKNENYFKSLFLEKTNKLNIDAIDFSSGLTIGNYQNINYIINFRPGDFLESTVYSEGCWEKNTIQLISQFLENSSGIMLDIGANIGLISIPLAIKHSSIQFHCFEAHPEIYARLNNNINLNKISNIDTANCAISNSNEKKLAFYAQKKSSNMGLSSLNLNLDIDDYEKIIVETKNIDRLFIGSSKKIVLIKIDTQGSELDVIKSSFQIIKRDRPIIIFELEDDYYTKQNRAESKRNLENLFLKLNYSLYNVSKGINYYPKVDIKKKYNGDVLCIPN